MYRIKIIQSGSYVIKTIIKPSKISGMGLFAVEKIKRGEFIKQLQGELCAKQALDALSSARNTRVDDALQVDDDEYLVLSYESKILNHSCNPNAAFRNRSDVYAIRDIEPGEEITSDYSTTVGADDDWTMTCNCGENNCRNHLGSFLTLPKITLEKYRKLDALPDFIKRQSKEAAKFIEITATKAKINR